MKQSALTKATLGRLPGYLQYLQKQGFQPGDTISATTIARELRLGEVQVRKDLGAVSGTGRPKVGYNALQLMAELESCLNGQEECTAVIVGAGRLGRALLDYEGFGSYGVCILGAFDRNEEKQGVPMTELETFLRERHVRVGVVTVGEESAQEVCDRLVQGGVEAIWSFAPGRVELPEGVMLKQENLALSLAHLKMQLG